MRNISKFEQIKKELAEYIRNIAIKYVSDKGGTLIECGRYNDRIIWILYEINGEKQTECIKSNEILPDFESFKEYIRLNMLKKETIEKADELLLQGFSFIGLIMEKDGKTIYIN